MSVNKDNFKKAKIFISHSNKFPKLTEYIFDFLKESYDPIVVERIPNYGKSWSPNEKVNYCLDISDAVIILATPDDKIDGKFQPRQNVIHEIGLAQHSKKPIIYLKEESTDFPSNVNPVYISFDMKKLEEKEQEIINELISIGYPPKREKTTDKKRGSVFLQTSHIMIDKTLFEGISLGDYKKIIKSVDKIMEMTKSEQRQYANYIRAMVYSEDREKQLIAGGFIECVLEYDTFLIPMDWLIEMAEDANWTIRSIAAVSFFILSEINPGIVPVDIIGKLASPHEDWYVSEPGMNSLKVLSRTRPTALHILKKFAESDDRQTREYAASAFRHMAAKDPDLVPRELISKLTKAKDGATKSIALDTLKILDSQKVAERVEKYTPF